MSGNIGDKARFNRLRKKRIALRERLRELVVKAKAQGSTKTESASTAPAAK